MFCWLVSEMQSAQDDGWIDGFDEKWNRRTDSAEKTAKRAAGLEVSACRIAIGLHHCPVASIRLFASINMCMPCHM